MLGKIIKRLSLREVQNSGFRVGGLPHGAQKKTRGEARSRKQGGGAGASGPRELSPPLLGLCFSLWSFPGLPGKRLKRALKGS